MVLGYSTNAFVKHSLLDSFEMIADSGFKGVEIMCDQPHLYPPEYDTQKLDEVNAALERNNLKPTNLNSFTLFAVGDTPLLSGDRQTYRMRQYIGAAWGASGEEPHP